MEFSDPEIEEKLSRIEKMDISEEDKLLKQVAETFTSSVRKSDAVFRYGGDEFAIILTNIHKKEESVIVAKRTLEKISRPFYVDDHKVNADISIGISIYPDDARDPDSLIKRRIKRCMIQKQQALAINFGLKNGNEFITVTFEGAFFCKSHLQSRWWLPSQKAFKGIAF